MVGLLIDSSKDLYFIGLEAKASVVTARAAVLFGYDFYIRIKY